MDKNKIDQIVDLYNHGYKVYRISEITGAESWRIYYYLRRADVIHHRHKRNSPRCRPCEYNHLQHKYCMKQDELSILTYNE